MASFAKPPRKPHPANPWGISARDEELDPRWESPALTSYEEVYEGVSHHFGHLEVLNDCIREPRRPRILDELVDPASAKDTGLSPDEKFQRLLDGLDQMGLNRSRTQLMFHDAMVKSVVPKIYNRDLASNEDRIMRRMGWHGQLKPQVAISTPRQWGKTSAVAMFMAAFADGARHTEQAVFSTGKRASQRLRDYVYNLILKKIALGYLTDHVSVRKVDERTEIVYKNGQISKMFFYPSRAKICTTPDTVLRSILFLSPSYPFFYYGRR